MLDFDPASIGAKPVASARPVFNSSSTAGSANAISSEDFDPASIGAKPVAAQEDFDPSTLGASMVDPEAIKARVESDPTYIPTNDELQTLFDAEQKATLGQKAGQVLKGIGKTAVGAAKNAWGSLGEVGSTVAHPSVENAGRATSTALESISQAASGAVGMVTKPIANWTRKIENFFDPAGAFNRWKLDYLANLAQRQSSNSEEFQRSVLGIQQPFAPLPQTAATGALALQLLAAKAPAVGATGEAALMAQKAAAANGVVKAALAGAGQPVAQSVAEQAAAKAGGALETTGGIAKAVGAFPRKAVEAVASPVVGEDLAHKAATLGEGYAALHSPVVGAIAGAEGAGIGMERAGQAIKGLANTPAAGPFGRLVNFAKASDTPEWLKTLASNPAVKTLYGAASSAVPAVGGALKGVAKGAALGGAYGLAAGDNPEELGSDVAAFGAFGVMHGGDTVKQRLLQRRAAGVADLVGKNLQAGVAPEVLAKVPDAAMMAVADLPYLGIQDSQGRNLQGQFLDNKGMTARGQTGADGFYDGGSHTVFFNADNLANNPASWSSIFHEVMHPLMESEVANRPELVQQIDDAVKRQGLNLNDAKQGYVKNLLQPEFDAAKTDPAIQTQQIADRIAALDADSANRWGDPDHWIRSELLADAGRDALGTHAGITSAEGSINNALKPTAGKILQSTLEKLGVSFKSRALGGTVIPGFQDVVSDPSLRKSVYKLLKAQRDFAPGVTEGAEQGVKLTPADMGTAKAPFYTLPNGNKGNKYSEVVPDGKGGEKTVMRNPGQVRKAERVEASAVKKYMQPGQRLAKMPAAFYADPNIGEWTKQAARAAEASGANGTPLEAWYHGIGKSGDANWKGSVRKTLGNVLASRQKFFVMPQGLFASKAGNPLMDVFSIAGFERKAQAWMNRSGPLSLERWGGDINKFKADVNLYNENHAKGLPGDANNLGADKRNVINAFLYGRNAKYEASNPLRSLLRNPQDRQGIIRSLRLDRLETLEPGTTDLTRPDYSKGVPNYSPKAPEGTHVNEDGVVVPDKINFGTAKIDNPLRRTSSNRGSEGNEPLITFADEERPRPTAYYNAHSHAIQNGLGREEAKAYADRMFPKSVENVVSKAATEHGSLHASQFSPPAKDYKGEHVTEAAIQTEDGKIYTGMNHAGAYSQLEEENPTLKGKALDNYSMSGKDGFITSTGRFVNRQEAYALAEKAKQIAESSYTKGAKKAAKENGLPEDAYLSFLTEPRLEADSFNESRKFSPKSKTLENSVGDDVPVVHLTSRTSTSPFVSPKNFGKGRANTSDLRGGPKSYFFVKGSPLGGDEKIFGQGGYRARVGTVDGSKLYNLDAGRPDPLKYFSTPNREEADDNVKAAGYHGILVGTDDGRKVVMMFRPVKVEDAGEFKGSTAEIKKQYSPEARPKTLTPNQDVRNLADDYLDEAGLPKSEHGGYAPINPALSRKIADFYDSAKHEPSNPAVKASYDAFKAETVAQYDAAERAGMNFEPWTKAGQPYKNSAEMAADVRDNQHLYYFPTEGGFGTGEAAQHPLLDPSGITSGGKEIPVNDAFRAVHDLFGHAKEGYEFGPRGELNAFLSHSKMYSDAARPAMAAETMGQNSWVNFGKHLRNIEGKIPAKGETGYVAPQDRPFAEQKATVLPPDLLSEASIPKQFSPQSKAGKALADKGYDMHLEDYGAGIWSITVTDNWGHEVGNLHAKQIDPLTAEVSLIRVNSKNQGEGIGTALYHELGHVLQQNGITKVTGYDINPAVPKLREKVFGAAVRRGKELVSPVMPDKQFSPAAETSQINEKKAARAANRIAFLTDKAGGATFNVVANKFVGKTKNFGVSIYPDRSVILSPKELTQDRVRQFIHDNADLLQHPENNVGTWFDKDSKKIYLDVSLGLPDRKLAEYAGWKYNQKAIWDSEQGTEIPTGGSGEALEQMPPASERLQLLQREYELQHPQHGQTTLAGMGHIVLDPRSNEVKNVRDLEAVRPDRELTPNEQAASDLARKEVRQRVQLLPSTDDRVKVRRALIQGVTEVSSMLDKQAENPQFNTGKDWYGADIKKMEGTTKLLFPETKDETKMTMFKLLLAGLSGGATPKENYSMAAEAFAHYLKTGEVPSTSNYRVSEKGAKRQLGRSGKQTSDKLNQMLEKHGGEAGLTKYLLTKHAVTDDGNKDAYGALDIGPKYGRFFLNLTGHQDEVTVDLWATRTWRRWMGTPFSRVKGGGGESRMEMTDIPTDSERNAILDAFKQIADNINNEIAEPQNHLTPMSIQAMLWFYEKDLFASRGLRVDRGSFSGAAEDYAKNPVHKRTTPVVTGVKKTDINQPKLL